MTGGGLGGMRKYGTFGDTSYVSIGDEYEKKMAPASRLVGANFRTAIGRVGKHSDATFGKFLPLYEKEKFEDTSEEKIEKIETLKKLNVSERPFRYSSPPKKSTGLGNYYGCLGPKVPHGVDPVGPVDDDGKPRLWRKGEFPSAQRNVVTNPPKKGTYGYMGTTISEAQRGPTGVAGEYIYLAEEYERIKVLEREEKAKAKTMNITEKPFYPPKPAKKGCAGMPGRTLGGKGHGICGEYSYATLGPPPRPDPGRDLAPFRATNPIKQGYNCTLSKYPKYMEDPMDVKLAAQRQKHMEEIAEAAVKGPFRPNGGVKAAATQSVLKINVLRKLP